MKSLGSHAPLVALAGLLSATMSPEAVAQPSQEELMRRAKIVFVGTVLQVGAVSFDAVPVSNRTLVVRVDSILAKPPAISLAPKDKVTVEAKDPSAYRKNQRMTFYTESWILGQGVAVREVAHEAAPKMAAKAVAAKREENLAAARRLEDAELRSRIQSADVVAFGWVKEVRPLRAPPTAARLRRIVTEHDADWREAVVHVESGIKGVSDGQEIVVRFPASLDVAWRNFPKLKVGDKNVFALQKDQLSGVPKAVLGSREVDAHAVLGPQNVLPPGDLERVRTLARP